MIQNYRIPKKAGTQSSEILSISEEFQLIDAIHSQALLKIKVLILRNSNIKDSTLLLLKEAGPLHLTHLNLSENFSFITDQAIDILATCANIAQLESLNLADNQMTDDALITIARSPNFSRLTELIFFGNSDITSQGMVVLAESPEIRKLRILDLHATSVSDEGMGYFLSSMNSASLESLDLSMNWTRIGDRTLQALSSSKHCTKLKQLKMEDCSVTDRGIDALCESQNCSNLTELVFNNSISKATNVVTDRSLSSLAFSKNLLNLKNLELRNTEVTPKGLKTLSVSLACQKLEILRLSYCQQITNEACHYLEKLFSFQSLKKLYINSTKISQEQFKQLEGKHPQINFVF